MKKSVVALGLVAMVLSGCVAPVVVNTDKGPVTCDLYIRNFDWWDRSISYPDIITEDEAHAICRSIDSGR